MSDPIRGVADLTSGDWERLRVGLAVALREMAMWEMINLHLRPEVVPPVPDPNLSRLDRLLRRKKYTIPPLLQFYRVEECLFVECAGPLEDGGGVVLNSSQQRAIHDLGFRQATGELRAKYGYPNYRAYFPHEGTDIAEPPKLPPPGPYAETVDADSAADLALATLRSVGSAHPAGSAHRALRLDPRSP